MQYRESMIRAGKREREREGLLITFKREKKKEHSVFFISLCYKSKKLQCVLADAFSLFSREIQISEKKIKETSITVHFAQILHSDKYTVLLSL